MNRTISRAAAALLLAVAFTATSATVANAKDGASTNQLYPNGCSTLCLYTNPWWAGSQVNYSGSDNSYAASLNNKVSAFFNNTDCAVDFYSKANYTGTKTTVDAGEMSYWLSASTDDTWSSHKFRC